MPHVCPRKQARREDIVSHWSQSCQKADLPLKPLHRPEAEEGQRKRSSSQSPDLTANPEEGNEPCAGQMGQEGEATYSSDPALSPDHNHPVLELSRDVATSEVLRLVAMCAPEL